MTEDFPLKNLTLLENNPRRISKEQMEKLCKSMQDDPDFLKSRPVLVNLVEGKHIVYAGNQRVRAAKQLKMDTIPCIIENDLPDDAVRKRILLDNKTFGEFDWDILANEWDVDVLLDCGFSANDLIGFDNDDETEDTSEKKKGKKTKLTCPNCGNEFEK